MNSSYLVNPLMLLINTLFDLYILLVWLRFLLQLLRADFYNPISQFIVRLTTPPLRILRRMIPSIAGQDSASIVLCIALIYVKFLIMHLLDIGFVPIGTAMAPIGNASYAGLIVIATADLVALTFSIFIGAILIQVILSWINPGHHNPLIGLINRVAEPVLRPLRNFLPPLGGIDLTPLFAILVLMVAKMLLVPPIVYMGGNI